MASLYVSITTCSKRHTLFFLGLLQLFRSIDSDSADGFPSDNANATALGLATGAFHMPTCFAHDPITPFGIVGHLQLCPGRVIVASREGIMRRRHHLSAPIYGAASIQIYQ